MLALFSYIEQTRAEPVNRGSVALAEDPLLVPLEAGLLSGFQDLFNRQLSFYILQVIQVGIQQEHFKVGLKLD